MSNTYFPGPDHDWEHKTPSEVNIDSDLLQQAIDYAKDPAHVGSPPDLAAYLLNQNGGKQHDDGRTLGPTKSHGPTTGVVLRHGYRIAQWGDPRRVDMTFSISKSFLSTTCGLAYDKGLIKDLHEPVGNTVHDGGYDSPHNSQITWDHSLRQITEWDGTLWDKHHSAGNPDDELRTPQTPGTHYEYNDVRVNRFALSLLHLYGEPLPDILKREVMDPIQASNTWQWNGYDNSYVTINGQRMWSVSGGGHWGGGMWISALDLARFGYLGLQRGNWDGRQILSNNWISMAQTPTELCPTYGFMNWFLNTDRALFPSAPATHYFHGGAGANRVWVAPELDMVVVIRWIDPSYFDGFVKRVLAAIK